MHVLESCFMSHFVINKSKLGWMCFNFTHLHYATLLSFVIINHCKNEAKTSTCKENQL